MYTTENQTNITAKIIPTIINIVYPTKANTRADTRYLLAISGALSSPCKININIAVNFMQCITNHSIKEKGYEGDKQNKNQC